MALKPPIALKAPRPVGSSPWGPSAVGYWLFFLSVDFGPQEILGLQLSGIVCSFCLSIPGLGGFWGSSCRELSVRFVCQFRASGDSGAPPVRYCLFFLFVNFGPQGILELQLSGIDCSFCLSISGLWKFWGSSCRVLSVLCRGGVRRRRGVTRFYKKSNNPNLQDGE